MSDEIETIDRNPKSWAAWKREAERLQNIIDDMDAMDSEPVAWMHNNNDIGMPAITVSPKIGQYWMTEFKDVHPLYRHAQPALTPYAWSYDWASCVTCEGPQDFEPVIEREPPPQWAIDEGRVKNLITLYRTAQPAAVVLDEGRADFEAWMLKRWGRERRDDDFAKAKFIYGEDYADSYTRCMWKGWSESRAAMLNGGKS